MSATGKSGRTLFGGGGTQSLQGSDLADVIYGDNRNGGGVGLRAEERDGGDVVRGPGEVQLVRHAGQVHAFAAASGRGAGGATAWAVAGDDAGDKLDKVWSQDAMWYGLDDMLTGAPAIATYAMDGQTYLITAGLGVSLARLDGRGRPVQLDSLDWDWGNGLLRPGALVPFEQDGELRILVGGGEEGGVTVLRYANGALKVAQRTEDDGKLEVGDVSAMEVATVEGRRFAVIASRDEGSVSVWSFGDASPRKVKMKRAGDGESRFDLTEVEALAVETVGGETFVYAAGPQKLVTYRLTGEGDLLRVASAEGALALETVRLDGRLMLFAAEQDRIRVYEIADRGRLDLVETHDAGWGARITDLDAEVVGDRLLLLAAREDAHGHDLFSYGAAGDDVIDARAGADTVHGGDGDDVIHGGFGHDEIHGEGGNDFASGDAGDDVILGGDGDDMLEGGGGADTLDGGAGDDRLSVEGAGAAHLRGGAGDDRLEGARGKDRLWGDADDDFLFGDAGADKLRGGAGNDRLLGGDARDKLWGADGRDQVEGGEGNDRLWGEGGKDRLDGGDGADKLRGDGGHDRLAGGEDADKLWGGAGRDRLDGGADRDRIWGGGGKDVFVFADGDGKDRVMDFGGKDRLHFEDVARFRQLDISGRKGDAVIEHDGGVVIVEDVKPRELDAGDFLFG